MISSRPDKLRIALTGGTLSGNKGAAGMLESAVTYLGRITGHRITFDILSVYPSRDSKATLPPDSRLVPAPPLRLVVALPIMALFYKLFRVLHIPVRPLLSFGLLESVVNADMLVDISGISFVDGRYAALAYNISCILPGLLTGTPVVKLSQAIGPTRTPVNRMAARKMLERCLMVFARGSKTSHNLAQLGLTGFREAPDLAFLLGEGDDLPEPPPQITQRGGGRPVIGIAPSQVLYDKCDRMGIDLVDVLSEFAVKTRKMTGAIIVILTHSHLGKTKRSRNNDYHICHSLRDRIRELEKRQGEAASREDVAREETTHSDRPPGKITHSDVILVDEDLSPIMLRSIIAGFDIFIACRFHAMISALCTEVPCIVPSWSHKYGEVMSMFGQEDMVISEGDLSSARMAELAMSLLDRRAEVSASIASTLPRVKEKASFQLTYIKEYLEIKNPDAEKMSPRVLDPGRKASLLYDRFYSNEFTSAWFGHSTDTEITGAAASGGLVSALLIDLVESGRIDGAITARIDISGEKLDFKTVLCRSTNDIIKCGSSIYSDFDHLGGITSILRENEGRFAVVALPCQWKALDRLLKKNPDLQGKVTHRIGLWCGHATGRALVDDFLSSKGVRQDEIASFRYRRGVWRGETWIEMKDGSEMTLPFGKGYGLFQNLYSDCMKRCFFCEDHFARHSDISFGDAWLAELRGGDIKESMAIANTAAGIEAMRGLGRRNDVVLTDVSPALAIQAQKRAVIWHIYGTEARKRICGLFGVKRPVDTKRSGEPKHDLSGTGAPCAGSDRRGIRPRWNDFISSFMMLASWKMYTGPLRPLFLRTPWPFHYPWLLVQKFFLNF
ncbi:MAG: Coenzyme F420 hydrogenase/dehydrogenase, beta subunit C-terminal domain [Candidatus Krumholzibacteria bacterium]|nr:Coenzyme F420 hydrogenase/dehydrogenase, beta subunit C-terminal domain [Candidatus Krumholzibacteria bacterium]